MDENDVDNVPPNELPFQKSGFVSSGSDDS